MPVTSLDIAKVAAFAADAKKATDILTLDLRNQTSVCDYFVICSGSNGRLVDAIVDEVREKVRVNCDVNPVATEGREGQRWILLDYGSVVVHVFQPEVRDFFRLERLWSEAPHVTFGLEAEMPADTTFAPAGDELATFEISEDDLVDNLEESEDPVE